MIPIKFTVEETNSLCCARIARGTFTMSCEVHVNSEDIRTPEQNATIRKAIKKALSDKIYNHLYGFIEKDAMDLSVSILQHESKSNTPLSSEVRDSLNSLIQSIRSSKHSTLDLEKMELPSLIDCLHMEDTFEKWFYKHLGRHGVTKNAAFGIESLKHAYNSGKNPDNHNPE